MSFRSVAFKALKAVLSFKAVLSSPGISSRRSPLWVWVWGVDGGCQGGGEGARAKGAEREGRRERASSAVGESGLAVPWGRGSKHCAECMHTHIHNVCTICFCVAGCKHAHVSLLVCLYHTYIRMCVCMCLYVKKSEEKQKGGDLPLMGDMIGRTADGRERV